MVSIVTDRETDTPTTLAQTRPAADQNFLLDPKDTMKLLTQTLCLSLALALSHAHHQAGHQEGGHEGHGHTVGVMLDRCDGLEMDAVAVNEEGIPYFFKGDHVFKGFHGKAELSNQSFAELEDHQHLGHDTKVFSYYKHMLEKGFPKDISEVFPGIPDHLDAAVVCPAPECEEDTVIFFKGDDIYHYNVKTKKVEEKMFEGMPNCTSAFRFMEHYYCFHGHQFSKFDPKTGEVHGRYPKEARDYFMKRHHRPHRERALQPCHHFLEQDAGNDTWSADTIESEFKELHSEVDAVFSYENHLYMIKDDEVYVYRVGEPHTHLEGYPKPLKKELGVEGPIDAAFVCQDHHIAHIIKGKTVYAVDLNASPRVPVKERSFTLFDKVDTGMCGPDGVKLFKGNHYYHFPSVKIMLMARAIPQEHKTALELFGCDH
ncbi:unnamed protein product [Coregonus sp. 'balchen']|nr:unnamed protein product [Coregonus sp. 'balchen']